MRNFFTKKVRWVIASPLATPFKLLAILSFRLFERLFSPLFKEFSNVFMF